MKKLILIGFILCLATTQAYAAANHNKVVESAHTASNSITLAVSETSTIYTKSFPIQSANSELDIGVAYKMSTADGDVAIYFEQSFQKPTTEGAADATYMVTHEIDTSVTDTAWKLATIDSVDLMYGRFRIVGQGSNPTTTTISIKIVK